tara:strand:+ start:2332 stop:2625 length:294 start_codon:yes stop_codon:yes gene_type:complete
MATAKKKNVGKKLVAQKKANKKKKVDRAQDFNDNPSYREKLKARGDTKAAKGLTKDMDRRTAVAKDKVKAKQAKAKAKVSAANKAKTKRSAAKKKGK